MILTRYRLCLSLMLVCIWAFPVSAQSNSVEYKHDSENSLPMGKHYKEGGKGRGIVIYSTGQITPSSERKKREEDKLDKSWDMLKSIVIDTRKPVQIEE